MNRNVFIISAMQSLISTRVAIEILPFFTAKLQKANGQAMWHEEPDRKIEIEAPAPRSPGRTGKSEIFQSRQLWGLESGSAFP
jgi:hypothetical protein